MVRILFFGTADISKPFLERLIVDKHTVLCITKPDKPADRGQKIKIPAVKLLSQQFSIPFIQVEQWTPEILDEIRAFEPDLGIAVAFGKILPENVFNLPKFGTVNIHFSLLPKFRGAAPVQYALLKGESETGVTVFYVEKELDTGPILVRQSLEIDKMDNLKTLFEKLVPLGLEAMAETLEKVKKGDIKAEPQVGAPSFAPTLKKSDGLIDWNESAQDIFNKVRALNPFPGTWTTVLSGLLAGKRIKILKTQVIDNEILHKESGKVGKIVKNEGWTVLCAKGELLIKIVQPENKGKIKAWDFLQGGKFSIDDKLGCI